MKSFNIIFKLSPNLMSQIVSLWFVKISHSVENNYKLLKIEGNIFKLVWEGDVLLSRSLCKEI